MLIFGLRLLPCLRSALLQLSFKTEKSFWSVFPMQGQFWELHLTATQTSGQRPHLIAGIRCMASATNSSKCCLQLLIATVRNQYCRASQETVCKRIENLKANRWWNLSAFKAVSPVCSGRQKARYWYVLHSQPPPHMQHIAFEVKNNSFLCKNCPLWPQYSGGQEELSCISHTC